MNDGQISNAILWGMTALLCCATWAAGAPVLHLDASEFSTADPALSLWTDRSGWGNDATAPVGHEPAVVLGGLGGMPVVRFDDGGATDAMVTPDETLPAGSTAMHALIVAGSADDQGHMLVHNRGPGSTNLLYVSFLQINQISHGSRFDGTGANRTAFTGNVWNTSQAGIVSSVIRSDNSAALSVDGGSPHTIAAGGNALSYGNELTIGNQDVIGNSSFDGDIAELVVFDRVLSDDEERGILHILSNKWGTEPVSATQTQIDAGQEALAPIPEPGCALLFLLAALTLLQRRGQNMAAERPTVLN
jgi:hypothetical protein